MGSDVAGFKGEQRACVWILLVISAASMRYALCKNYFPNVDGKLKSENKVQELILFMNHSCYHIHHWITFTAVLVVFYMGVICGHVTPFSARPHDTLRYVPHAALLLPVAVLLPWIVEGLLFSDWNEIKGNCDMNRVCRRDDTNSQCKTNTS